jgi:hypothetical protein
MRLVVSVVLALVASGAAMQAVSRAETREIVGQRATLGDLRPPSFRVVPLATADEFFREAAETRARVDRARTKEPPTGGPLSDYE